MNRLAVWILAAVMLPDAAMAALRVWPSATCAATLQACIDGAASGDEGAVARAIVASATPTQREIRMGICGGMAFGPAVRGETTGTTVRP